MNHIVDVCLLTKFEGELHVYYRLCIHDLSASAGESTFVCASASYMYVINGQGSVNILYIHLFKQRKISQFI